VGECAGARRAQLSHRSGAPGCASSALRAPRAGCRPDERNHLVDVGEPAIASEDVARRAPWRVVDGAPGDDLADSDEGLQHSFESDISFGCPSCSATMLMPNCTVSIGVWHRGC
jgi:hypothetical protein